MGPSFSPFSPRRIAAALVVATAASLTAGAAAAADPGPAPSAVADPLGGARALIAKKQWPEAVAELQRVNETGNADWHNLMGYSLRHFAKPDLDRAESHYEQALRINPKHRGALEYSGELHLTRGDLAKAEQRLAALNKACFLPCEEYTELKAAIEAHKRKAGGKS